MSAVEFAEWIQFSKEEPFGDTRADYRSAIVAYTVARSQGSKKAKLADFLPFLSFKEDTVKSRAAEVQDAFLKATAGLKKRIMKKRK